MEQPQPQGIVAAIRRLLGWRDEESVSSNDLPEQSPAATWGEDHVASPQTGPSTPSHARRAASAPTRPTTSAAGDSGAYRRRDELLTPAEGIFYRALRVAAAHRREGASGRPRRAARRARVAGGLEPHRRQACRLRPLRARDAAAVPGHRTRRPLPPPPRSRRAGRLRRPGLRRRRPADPPRARSPRIRCAGPRKPDRRKSWRSTGLRRAGRGGSSVRALRRRDAQAGRQAGAARGRCILGLHELSPLPPHRPARRLNSPPVATAMAEEMDLSCHGFDARRGTAARSPRRWPSACAVNHWCHIEMRLV
jgi:hypothetical protein